VSALVSVIIPTYNWSAALKTSIASVVAQSHRRWELLVVGDACTDDSADVVRGFGDPRIRWHNLPVRAGSQSGPNNHGLTIANGEFIAYLGHDDVWHPDHLSSLVATQQKTGADLVCAVCVMHGPPGSGMRAATGLFVEGHYRPTDFFPPSSMLHTRALTQRIGPWRAPADIASPVDCEFLARAHQSGAIIASTCRLTAFKFNASWRRDSYRRRHTDEQAQMFARLQANPADCVAEELLAVLHAAREKRLIDIHLPDISTAVPGGYYRANLRNRGLDDEPSTPLAGRARWTVDTQTSALDWHAPEVHPEWGSFRWTGPSPVSVAILPVQAPARFTITVQMLNWLHVDIASEIRLSIDDAALPFSVHGDGAPAVQLRAAFVGTSAPAAPLRLRIETRRLRCPYFHHNGASADERWLGVCVNWIELDGD